MGGFLLPGETQDEEVENWDVHLTDGAQSKECWRR